MRQDEATRSSAVPADVCPDAEVLASWVEGRLIGHAQALAEQHVAGCARCLSVLAAMERAAPVEVPPLQPRRAWMRWLVPVAAAATAVAIWVAIPEQQEVPTSNEMASSPPAAGPSQPLAVPEAQAPPAASPAPEPRADASRRQSEPAPLEAPADSKPSEGATQNRLREERALSDAASLEQGARENEAAANLDAASRSLARDAAAPAAPAAPAPGAAVGSLAETAQVAPQRAVPPSIVEAASHSDEAIRWRIVGAADVERSLDGGQSWTRTERPPAAVSAIRVTDALSATVITASGTRFSTTDGGKTWTPAQEKPAAPF
jgi:hypothetical protein